MNRAVMVLLDFSKAYDTVWRERLLLSMSDQGMPLTMIRWLKCFLTNRQARVRFNGVLGHSKEMKQGVPQGSVLSPIMFLFYINNLARILPKNNINTLFADDVGTLSIRKTLAEAEQAAQLSVDVVSSWAKAWKLNLNASKSEASFLPPTRKNQNGSQTSSSMENKSSMQRHHGYLE